MRIRVQVNSSKGAKAATIFFTKQYALKDEDAEDDKEKAIRILKHYSVFHSAKSKVCPGGSRPYRLGTVAQAGSRPR